MKKFKETQKQKKVTQAYYIFFTIIFSGFKGTTVVKNLNKTLENVLSNNVKHALHTQVNS